MTKKEMIPVEDTEIVERDVIPGPNVPAPINLPTDTINQGTVAIEASRAVAEAQGKLLIAKKFPRDEIAAYRKRGIRNITTFAVNVDDDYIADFGLDSLACVYEYGRLLSE